jgi:serine/threonine protein kinase
MSVSPTSDPGSYRTTPLSPNSSSSSPVAFAPPLGLFIGKPLGLSITKPAGLSMKKSYNDYFDPLTSGLGTNTLEDISVPGHRSKLFKIKTKNGNVKGVRKVATEPNIFEETTAESKVYQRISSLPGAEIYLIPYLGSNANATQAYLNLGYVEGDDIIDVLKKNPTVETYKEVLKGVVEALLWLTKNNYVHGDISTSNFRRGKDGQIRILDLGRATFIRTRVDVNKEFRAFQEMILNLGFSFETMPEPEAVEVGENPKKKLIEFYNSILTWLDTVEGGKRRKQTKKNKKSKRRGLLSKPAWTTRKHKKRKHKTTRRH